MRTGGPPGGLGYDIRMRPDSPDIMYVTEAFAGVHMSTDGGRTWLPVNEGIDVRAGPSGDAIPVFSLAIDPNNYDIIWAGTQNVLGIYRSPNGGLTWEKRTNGVVEKTVSFRGFAVEPGHSNVVYAAGEVDASEWAGQPIMGRQFNVVKGVVYKSTDGGLNWRPIWRGDNLARYVLIDPTDVNIVYVSTGIFDREAANSDRVRGEPGGVGVLKSTDGGKTWRQINTGLKNLYVGSLFMHPENPRILLAGAGNFAYQEGNGVYLTLDGGEHWERVQEALITSVEFATGDPRIAYAGGDRDFFRSDDSGRTWKRFQGPHGFGWGPVGMRSGFPIDFQVDPRDPMRIFVNNYKGGNMLSEDGGQRWVLVTAGYTGADVADVAVHPSNPAIVYANGKSGPFVSGDSGKSWRGINTFNPQIPGGKRIIVDPHNPEHVLMTEENDGRVYESFDGGETWNMTADYRQELWDLPAADRNKVMQGMQAIAFAPSAPSTVYGGFGLMFCANGDREELCNTAPIVSILLSKDGGHTWVRQYRTALDGLSVTAIVVHPTNADRAWAATAGGGVFRTVDGGASWQPASENLAKMVMALALDPKKPDVLYAGTARNGVFKSEDGGVSWRQSSYGMAPSEPVFALAVDPLRPGVVYTGSRSSGVFLSQDGGVSWHPINKGLRTRSVATLAVSADGGVVYAGTRGEGVFRLETATASQ